MAEEARLPSQVEIANVPRWARVAFAARCARRVQPLFVAAWPDAPEKHIQAIDLAITIAEQSAADAAAADDDAAAAAAADAAEEATATDTAFAAAADEAARAAAAAALAAADEADDAAESAAAAADAAVGAAVRLLKVSLYPLIRRDFDTLLTAALSNEWDENTPVPEEVFGPMWPDGSPLNWPRTDPLTTVRGDPDPIRGLLLDFHFGPDTDPADIEEGIVNLYEAANRYHMARGKGVLSPDKFRHMIAHVLVPVGGF